MLSQSRKRKDYPKMSQPISPYHLRNMPRIMANIAPVVPPVVPPPVAPPVVLPPAAPMATVPTVVIPVAFTLMLGAINASNIINLRSKTGVLAYD